ncbi:hypothetical protein EST62_01560 [Chlorobaculum sp. 24CR]|uniref:hypothetical protein n=1 Tax=Chlorobaculum sp. 24CR TaxID=2508878 RepID=UPI00100BA2C2|nr:hypothetical protein [Chlorobaculum sp. 24CR]RXK88784.1 hypothetical protein EST62_01560 [Chlorobaculum sp. 24CR]
MLKEISKTDKINQRLLDEKKVTTLDEPKHLEAIRAMNIQMDQVRREYQVKDRKSQITAANVILTR